MTLAIDAILVLVRVGIYWAPLAALEQQHVEAFIAELGSDVRTKTIPCTISYDQEEA